ncbi:unnamed protein product [Ectocarpus sp. 12 AP-2014]
MKGVGGDAPSTFWNPRADQATLREMVDKVVKRRFDPITGQKMWTTQCWGFSRVKLVKGRSKEAVMKTVLERWAVQRWDFRTGLPTARAGKGKPGKPANKRQRAVDDVVGGTHSSDDSGRRQRQCPGGAAPVGFVGMTSCYAAGGSSSDGINNNNIAKDNNLEATRSRTPPPEEPAAGPPIEVLALTAIDITKASLLATSDVLTIEEILEFFLDGTDPEVFKAVEAVAKASVE